MKTMIMLLAGSILASFTNRPVDDDEIGGVWMGYYRSQIIKERVIVKFNDSDHMEFYTGGISDPARSEGSYRILGDSVSFTYRTPEGEVITMEGRFNRRRNFVDGVWKENDKNGGSFYLEKQKVQEYFAQP